MTKLFHWSKYITQQSQVMLDYFQGGGKIIEISGPLLHDEILTHALSGYEHHSQSKILTNLFNTYPNTNLIYCISAKDLVRDKQFSQKYMSFEKYILKELARITSSLHKKAHIVITLMDDEFVPPHVRELEELLQNQWYTTEHYPLWKLYHFPDYPTLVSSYEWQTGKSLLCASSWAPYTIRSPLPTSYSEQHPLNILAQAYQYRSQETLNLSVLEKHITDTDSEAYRHSCTSLIQERIVLYEKLLLSGYIDEQEVESLKKLLLYLEQ